MLVVIEGSPLRTYSSAAWFTTSWAANMRPWPLKRGASSVSSRASAAMLACRDRRDGLGAQIVDNEAACAASGVIDQRKDDVLLRPRRRGRRVGVAADERDRAREAFEAWVADGRKGGDDTNYRPRMQAGFIAGFLAGRASAEAEIERLRGLLKRACDDLAAASGTIHALGNEELGKACFRAQHNYRLEGGLPVG
jgi:hypothetical protein